MKLIELKGVSYYINGLKILEDVSFDVERGENVSLIGPNGAGKTTLVKIILGILRPTQGIVKIFGRDPQKLNSTLRQRIGYVPQVSDVNRNLPFLVRDIVEMGLYSRVGFFKPIGNLEKRIDEVLDLMGIRHLKNEPIGRLSGGEWQRMMIARALVNAPDLLILDEPTTALDNKMTQGIFELLNKINREWGATILVVSHDISIVSRYVDKVLCLAIRLVAHGNPREVLKNEVFQCLYGKGTLLMGHGEVPHIVLPEHD